LTDIPGDTTTTAALTLGSTLNGNLELVGDHDWFRISLAAGQPVTVTLDGITLDDPYLYVRDSAGTLLYSNDDIVDGVNRNSEVTFTPSYSGTYYIDVGAWNNASAGTYQVGAQAYTPPPVATNDQIASQLTNGFWNGDYHHWAVTQGGTITVNISTLNTSEQSLARAALSEWTDIIGVNFKEVTTGGQITFDGGAEGIGPHPELVVHRNPAHLILTDADGDGALLDGRVRLLGSVDHQAWVRAARARLRIRHLAGCRQRVHTAGGSSVVGQSEPIVGPATPLTNPAQRHLLEFDDRR